MSTETKDLIDFHVTGTEVHYFVLCRRKLWWKAHGMEQENVQSGAGAENVAMGKQIHADTYPEQTRKDVMIDDLLRLDFTDDGVVHEIKKSKGGQRATQFQLLYYLYYLKHEKGIETTGMIDYPKQHRTLEVTLTPELEAEVEEILEGIQVVRNMPNPPAVAEPMAVCKKCAYQDLCWG